MTKRTLMIRIVAVLLLVALAALMMAIGRGHTVYFDNVTLENGSETYSAFHKVVVSVKGEKIAKLGKRERGMTTCIGDKLKVEFAVTETKGAEEVTYVMDVKLPHDVDGIVVNMPALLAGQPQEVWFSEFVPLITEQETEPEELDEGMDMELGEGFSLE